MDVLSPELEFLNELPIRPLNIADVKGCHPLRSIQGTTLRAIWNSRLTGRATPLLVVLKHFETWKSRM